MGATSDIKETNLSLKLVDLACGQCSQKFTEQEIDRRNFDIYWDTSNDVELTAMDYKSWHQFSIIIRSIEHQTCPEIINEYE